MTTQARNITLHELKTLFHLTQTEDLEFFPEWQENLSGISAEEKRSLTRIKSNYNHLIEYPPTLEDTVKMVVLSPLLDLAGFYQEPFRIKTETSIELITKDEGVLIKGKIDVLVLNQKFWILIIESKGTNYSLEAGRTQALAYMLSTPHPEKPIFGLISNGSSFIFLKLLERQYALSRIFSLLNPGNELEAVLRSLKRIASAIA